MCVTIVHPTKKKEMKHPLQVQQMALVMARMKFPGVIVHVATVNSLDIME